MVISRVIFLIVPLLRRSVFSTNSIELAGGQFDAVSCQFLEVVRRLPAESESIQFPGQGFDLELQ